MRAIPGITKEKKENHENGSLFYTFTYNQKEKEHEKTGFWTQQKTEKKALALTTLSNKNGNGNSVRNRLRGAHLGIGFSRSGSWMEKQERRLSLDLTAP